MREWLTSMLSRIENGSLLPEAYYRELNCDAALDARDGDAEFAGEWERQFKIVAGSWETAAVDPHVLEVVEAIRRESFLVVSRATGQHEIAGYVSEDFDLIVRSRLLGLEADILRWLWGFYELAQFPQPPFDLAAHGDSCGAVPQNPKHSRNSR